MTTSDNQSPSEKKSANKKLLILLVLIISIFLSTIAFLGWYSLVLRTPITTYKSSENHFKYASIGTEAVNGIPYWIWVVLPRIFPENLPASGAYTSLGLTWEEGRELPIGITKENIGIARVGMNCAVCHVGTVRETDLSKPKLLLAAPSTKFDVRRYAQFFFDCARDPRFNPGFILPEIEYNHHLSLPENLFYRFVLIPGTRKALLKQAQAYQWMNNRPPTGAGRTDMNFLKIQVLGMADDLSVGSTDIASIWQSQTPKNYYYHSDGINSSLKEVILSSALATGTTSKEINLENLERIEQWLQTLSAPTYPFKIDRALAEQGQEIFTQNCASCHGKDSKILGRVLSIAEIGTDDNRTLHWTKQASEAMNDYAQNYDWDFENFRDTSGYVVPTLAGIWAKAPYLHNGSVPSLQDLLSKSEARPQKFYRGYDVYDQEKVGFVATGKVAAESGFLVDTTLIGNNNQGHNFGTELQGKDKIALIEYLKTL